MNFLWLALKVLDFHPHKNITVCLIIFYSKSDNGWEEPIAYWGTLSPTPPPPQKKIKVTFAKDR